MPTPAGGANHAGAYLEEYYDRTQSHPGVFADAAAAPSEPPALQGPPVTVPPGTVRVSLFVWDALTEHPSRSCLAPAASELREGSNPL